jgi:hypothetical protein
MTTERKSLLDELAQIDEALINGDATEEQEERGRQLVTLANAAPQLRDALEFFFTVMFDYENFERFETKIGKGYVSEAIRQACEALIEANGGVL